MIHNHIGAYLKLFLFFIVLSFSYQCDAQQVESEFFNDTSKVFKKGTLMLEIDNANFLKNNEYFNDITEGYTLMGFWLRPTLLYHPTNSSEIEAGFLFLKFSGENKFYNKQPVFAFQQRVSENTIFVLGTIKHNTNHNMPAPMLDPERFYFNQAENGIQFLTTNGRYTNDTWLSWDKFILWGDSLQEQLTCGTSSTFLAVKQSRWSIDIPLELLFTHRGGQINRPKKPIETLLNAATGFTFRYQLQGRFNGVVTFDPQVYFYQKSTSDSSRAFKSGWGILPKIGLRSDVFFGSVGWWHSQKFIGPRGEGIYQSVSTVTPGFALKKNDLVYLKAGISKHYQHNLLLCASYEGYYFNRLKLVDYNFAITLLYRFKSHLFDFDGDAGY